MGETLFVDMGITVSWFITILLLSLEYESAKRFQSGPIALPNEELWKKGENSYNLIILLKLQATYIHAYFTTHQMSKLLYLSAINV